MPHGNTTFKSEWLVKKDDNGFPMSEWCGPSKISNLKAYCRLCNKDFLCNNQGLQQLVQHSRGIIHKKLSTEVLKGTQLTLKPSCYEENKTDKDISKSTAKLFCISERDKGMGAELIWAMKVAKSHYSYESCNEMKETLQAMLPGLIPDNFSMSARKVSYLISDALGPYFQKVLVQDIKSGNSPFTLEYDETTNKQVAKQLDIKIRYWSSFSNQVSIEHLQTYMIGHATGQILTEKIMLSINDNGLPLSKLLMLGSDGPNVNKSVWNKINETLLSLDRPGGGLIDMGTCNLHVVHNAFGKGLSSFGNNISDFVIDTRIWFKLSAARREDLEDIQRKLGFKKHVLLKHVECRWLTLLPALERILEQWPAICEYFLKFVVKQQLSVIESPRYRRIKLQLVRNNETLLEMHFLVSIAELFTKFLAFFQREEPLIHVLYDRLLTLIKQLLSRFLLKQVLDDCKSTQSLTLLNVELLQNQLDNNTIEIGCEARKCMTSLSLDKQKLLYLGIRKFYSTVPKYLLQKLSFFSSTLLSRCSFLQPLMKNKDGTLEYIQKIAKRLPMDININTLSDEWRAYQFEDIPEDWRKNEVRIDNYWHKHC